MVYNTELLTQRPFGLKVRVAIIDLVARALGMLVHIEGFPYGSNRHYSGLGPPRGLHSDSALPNSEAFIIRRAPGLRLYKEA